MCRSVGCGFIAAFLGTILGLIIGILFFLGIITSIVTPIIIALAIALFVLLLMIILLSIASFRNQNSVPVCLCNNAIGLIITSVVTILAAIASLSVELVTGSVIIAILIGIGAAAFLTMLILLICWLICIVQDNCNSTAII